MPKFLEQFKLILNIIPLLLFEFEDPQFFDDVILLLLFVFAEEDLPK